MKYKILAGSLTAHPNNDGTHLDNYLKNKQKIAKNICEGLALHDQICIPIQDYLTACGLISILGEKNTISLLEFDQIRFLRSRHQLTFLKARHLPKDIGLSSPIEPHPWSSPNDESIALALSELEKRIQIKNRKLLERLLLQQTDSIDIHDCLKEIKKNTFKTFRHTSVASKPINNFLGDTPTGHVQATTLGNDPLDVNNPIKVIIGLATVFYETHLLNKYNCSSSSSTVDFNNLIGLTTPLCIPSKSENLWAITELHKIPDLGEIILQDNDYCQKVIEITRSSNATQFREWFHNNKNLSAKEIQQEFVCLMDKEPWFKSSIGSVICWGTVTLAGAVYGPLAGIPLGLANKLLGMVNGQSPKYFISELKKAVTHKQ